MPGRTPTLNFNFSMNEEAAKPLRIEDLPEDSRPRERMRMLGPEALSDAELLAVFFGSGSKGLNVVEMSEALIRRYGSLSAMSRQSYQELQQQYGIGPVKALHLAAIFELGRRANREKYRQQALESSNDVYELLGLEMRSLAVESVRLVLVDTKLHLIRVEEIHKGKMDSVSADIRLILRAVLRTDAHSFFMAHNHPSGDPHPSFADQTFTRKLKEACDLSGVRMLDHIIIGQPSQDWPTGYYSFLDAGRL
jgi:DNA repair protein RadC